MSTAASAAGEPIQGRKGAELDRLADHPGEDALAHQGKLWIEQAERKLAGLRLLGVANGDEPDEAKSIKIFPLELIPSLPTSHAYHQQVCGSQIPDLRELGPDLRSSHQELSIDISNYIL